jgi:hypothetical protein
MRAGTAGGSTPRSPYIRRFAVFSVVYGGLEAGWIVSPRKGLVHPVKLGLHLIGHSGPIQSIDGSPSRALGPLHGCNLMAVVIKLWNRCAVASLVAVHLIEILFVRHVAGRMLLYILVVDRVYMSSIYCSTLNQL